MIQRAFLLSLCALAATTTVLAQGDETQFNQRQAKALNAFAKRAFDKGFPRIAKVVWMKTIKLYDTDNKTAWTSLGYIKIGSSWNIDTKRPYPTKDTGKGSDGKPLETKYRALEKALAGQHRSAAKKYDKADRKDRAMHHWQMVLRWVKNDPEASAALEHKEIGALSGTDLEKTLYERSKMVEKSIEEGTQWVVFEPNKASLWKRIVANISIFLSDLWRLGLLTGTSPEQAFFVQCDEETNPKADIDKGRITTQIGVAVARPVEFIIFRVSQRLEDQGQTGEE